MSEPVPDTTRTRSSKRLQELQHVKVESKVESDTTADVAAVVPPGATTAKQDMEGGPSGKDETIVAQLAKDYHEFVPDEEGGTTATTNPNGTNAAVSHPDMVASSSSSNRSRETKRSTTTTAASAAITTTNRTGRPSVMLRAETDAAAARSMLRAESDAALLPTPLPPKNHPFCNVNVVGNNNTNTMNNNNNNTMNNNNNNTMNTNANNTMNMHMNRNNTMLMQNNNTANLNPEQVQLLQLQFQQHQQQQQQQQQQQLLLLQQQQQLLQQSPPQPQLNNQNPATVFQTHYQQLQQQQHQLEQQQIWKTQNGVTETSPTHNTNTTPTTNTTTTANTVVPQQQQQQQQQPNWNPAAASMTLNQSMDMFVIMMNMYVSQAASSQQDPHAILHLIERQKNELAQVALYLDTRKQELEAIIIAKSRQQWSSTGGGTMKTPLETATLLKQQQQQLLNTTTTTKNTTAVPMPYTAMTTAIPPSTLFPSPPATTAATKKQKLLGSEDGPAAPNVTALDLSRLSAAKDTASHGSEFVLNPTTGGGTHPAIVTTGASQPLLTANRCLPLRQPVTQPKAKEDTVVNLADEEVSPLKVKSSFLCTVYRILEDARNVVPTSAKVISWEEEGRGFKVWQPGIFTDKILPKYTHSGRRNLFRSFQRQLNIYNFKMNKGTQVYSHPLFYRGCNILSLKNTLRPKYSPRAPPKVQKKKKKAKESLGANDGQPATSSSSLTMKLKLNDVLFVDNSFQFDDDITKLYIMSMLQNHPGNKYFHNVCTLRENELNVASANDTKQQMVSYSTQLLKQLTSTGGRFLKLLAVQVDHSSMSIKRIRWKDVTSNAMDTFKMHDSQLLPAGIQQEEQPSPVPIPGNDDTTIAQDIVMFTVDDSSNTAADDSNSQNDDGASPDVSHTEKNSDIGYGNDCSSDSDDGSLIF